MLTIPQAKTLVQGQWIYDAARENADGSPKRYKVTSVKTWKTRPNEVRVNLKYGLKTFLCIDQLNISHLYTLCRTEEEAIEQRELVLKVVEANDLPGSNFNSDNHRYFLLKTSFRY